MNIKQPIVATAALAVVAVAGLGAATTYAVTDENADGRTSMAERIAKKFNLDADEVKAEFTAEREARKAEHKADRDERIAAAVESGDLTRTQADYIKSALAEMETLRSEATPDDVSSEDREQMKAKRDALKEWAESNDIDLQVIGGGRGGMGHGGPRG